MTESNQFQLKQPGKQEMPFKLMAQILFVVFIFIALGILIFKNIKNNPNEIVKIQAPDYLPVSSPKQDELAEGFPKDVPLFKKEIILSSYSYKNNKTGDISEVFAAFSSKEQINSVINFYEDWAEDEGWKISSSKKNLSENYKSANLSFIKNGFVINISIEQNNEENSKISILYKNPLKEDEKKNLENKIKNIKI